MANDVYRRLQQVLDTLPNGFPATDSGVEIKLLKKIFTEDEAEFFMKLKMHFETPDEIAKRLDLPEEKVAEKLDTMWKNGQLFMVDFGSAKVYRIMPWAFGIYEFQIHRMDREFAELNEEYFKAFGKEFFETKPQLMHVVPVEQDIPAEHTALTYESVSKIVENGQSFAVNECICKKEQGLMDNPCQKPTEVCLAIAPVPGVFENHHWGRAIDKDEAYKVLNKAEENALVHLTWNIQGGHFFICNCCGCCCGVLRGITDLGILDSVNTTFCAEIDPDLCTTCGTCADERCQIEAIKESDQGYEVIPERCIGCGLCISACPTEAITLVRKNDEAIVVPPENEDQWYEERGKQRGVDFSEFK